MLAWATDLAWADWEAVFGADESICLYRDHFDPVLCYDKVVYGCHEGYCFRQCGFKADSYCWTSVNEPGKAERYMTCTTIQDCTNQHAWAYLCDNTWWFGNCYRGSPRLKVRNQRNSAKLYSLSRKVRRANFKWKRETKNLWKGRGKRLHFNLNGNHIETEILLELKSYRNGNHIGT